MKFVILYTTVDNKNKARRLAHTLLKERLIACANIFLIESLYWWQGKIEKAKEYGLFLKTTQTKGKKVEKRLQELHPYSLPCIIQLPIHRGFKEYLNWIKKETSR